MTSNTAGTEHVPNVATGDRGADNTLIARYVRMDRNHPGLDRAHVMVGSDGVPIWALIGHMRGGGGIAGAARAYELPEAAVTAAVAYYHRHRVLIDHVLAINDGDFGDGVAIW